MAEGIPQAHDWKQLDSKEILELIKKAGVVGCGGATFPAHVKLAPNKPVDTFIVNGAECEPYLPATIAPWLKRKRRTNSSRASRSA